MLLLVYSGLAPWGGWRDLGLNPFAYLAAPIPAHVTNFDLSVNVLAYVPFGALLVLALHPMVRGWTAVLIALLSALLLAGVIEATQSYLPTRISSNLDLLTNSAGGLVGGLIAAPLSSALIDRGWLAEWRRQWFDHRSSMLLLVVALWPVAQIFPEPMLFGNGDVHGPLECASCGVGRGVSADAGGGGIWNEFDVAEFVLAEAFVVAGPLLAVGLAFTRRCGRMHPPSSCYLGLLAVALFARRLPAGCSSDRSRAHLADARRDWRACYRSVVTARGKRGPRVWSARIAVLALVALVIAVNVVPDNPYYIDAISDWRQGMLLNFNALAGWLSVLWPYALATGLLSAPISARGPAGPASL